MGAKRKKAQRNNLSKNGQAHTPICQVWKWWKNGYLSRQIFLAKIILCSWYAFCSKDTGTTSKNNLK